MKIGSILYNAIKAYLENEYMHDYRVVLHGILKNLCKELGFNKEDAKIEELVDFLRNYILEKRTKKYYTFDFKINGNSIEGKVIIERFGKIFDTIEEIRKLLYVYYAYSKNPSLTAQKIEFLHKVFKPIFDIPKSNKEIINDNERINEFYNKFFDWLIEQYKTKNFLNLCIVGNSGSGKTITTYFIAEEISKRIGEFEVVYISDIKNLFSFIDYCKKMKVVDNSIFVFDEAYVASLEFEKYFYRFLNILRWFTKTRRALTFIIIHSRHQLSQNLKQNVDYYFIFDEKRNIKIFNNSVDLSEILRNLRSFQGRVKFLDGYLKSVSILLPESKIIEINEKINTNQLKSKYEMLEGIASKMLSLANKMRINLVS